MSAITQKSNRLTVFAANNADYFTIAPSSTGDKFEMSFKQASDSSELPIHFKAPSLSYMDGSNAVVLTTKLAAIVSSVSSEATTRASAVSTVSSAVSSEAARAAAAEAVIQASVDTNTTAIAAETSARVSAVNTLSASQTSTANSLASEITRALAAEQTLSDSLTAALGSAGGSIADLDAAVSNVGNAINSEITNRQTAVSAEASARAAAITSEASTRATAITNLTNALNAEISRAEAAEGVLSDRISAILSNTDPAAIDSFTEALAAWASDGATLQSNIDTVATALTTDMTGVSSRLDAIEAAILSLQSAP